MQKFKLAAILAVAVIVLSACTSNNSQNNKAPEANYPAPAASNQSAPSDTTSLPAESQITLNLAEIAKHAAPADCWMAIDGQVYNFTPYVKAGLHPGGDKILNGCGKDASQIFASIMKHENGARNLFGKYLLGPLVQ